MTNVQRGSMWSEETGSFTLEESLHLVDLDSPVDIIDMGMDQ
jgi:hypothetical protein